MNKLLLLGDSVMKGVVFSGSEKKYKIYGDNGFDTLNQRGIEVANRSKIGATVVNGRDIFCRAIGDTPEGNAVIFEYGGNDCDFDWKEVAESPDGKHNPHTLPEVFREVYCDCIDTAKNRGLKVALTNLVPIDAEKYFKRISSFCNGENVLRWLGDVSMLYRWQEYYSTIVEDIARQKNCPLIDLRGEFLRSHDYKCLISDDGIHPSENGHRLARSIIDNSANRIFT